MNKLELAQRGWSLARGLRWIVRNPVTLDEARRVVADEVRRRDERLLTVLDELVWPFPRSPTHQLLVHAGVEPGDLRALVADRGVEGALEALRDAGVYVAYEEYQGKVEARRGSATFSFSPADFFNPVTAGDYMATTGGSRGAGTPVELSFTWQRRQGMKGPILRAMAGVQGARTAIWLPVFPSAAGFGAVMKNAAGGQIADRWFSQVPTDVGGIASHKQLANRFLPMLQTLARTGLPSPEHVPNDDPEPVVRWLQATLARDGMAILNGYASSMVAAARWAAERGIDLTGTMCTPSSEPVTAGKLAALRAAGMRPFGQYAFVPEGIMGMQCPHCDDEDYHLWGNELALVTRTRPRDDGTLVPAYLWTSLVEEAPRVMLNVENDDFGGVRHDVDCGCELGRLGLSTRLHGIRGMSKVVAAGITLESDELDRLVELELPARAGGGPGDYQLVEDEGPDGTRVSLRVHPRLGDVDAGALLDAVRRVLAGSDNGVLAEKVWMPGGALRILHEPPAATRAGKTLAYERLGAPTAAATPIP